MQQQQQRSSCDSCRRRKVGCDSAQPCRRCVESGLECTYGSIARRGLSTAYVRDLEQQVADLQRQLHSSAHDLPLSLRHGADVQQSHIDLLASANDDLVFQHAMGSRVYRFSSALNILRMVADMLNLGLGPPGTTSLSSPPGRTIVQALDSRLETPSRDELEWLNTLIPPQEDLHQLVACALNRALMCHECIDRDTLNNRINQLYSAGGIRLIATQKSFMSLLYALLALGERYLAASAGNEKDAAPPGFQYFRASRRITDVEYHGDDLDHVLAFMLQSRYLLSIPNFTSAHAILSSAVSTAVHMGLHLDSTAVLTSFSDEELFARRRVFAVLYMMDTYLSYILGLPRMLRSTNARSSLGLPAQSMMDEGEQMIAENPSTSIAETVMAQKLLHIYAKILDRHAEGPVESWVDKGWVTEVEGLLKSWEDKLPMLPSEASDSRILLAQLQLRLYLTGAQILLYAPCIHHLGRHKSDPTFNIDGFTYGSACVSAATQSVLLVEILHAQKILHEASWVPSYLLTWAAVVLTYFVMHSKTRVTIQDTVYAAVKANRILNVLGQKNVTDKRIHDCLEPYVEIAAGYEA